jgi:hypothetical protein
MVVFVVNLYISFFIINHMKCATDFNWMMLAMFVTPPVIASLIIFIKALIKDQIP